MTTTHAVGAMNAVRNKARRLDLVFRPLDTSTEVHRAADVLRAVWGSQQVPPHLLVGIRNAGGYAFSVSDDVGVMLGVSVGLLSNDGLHSHITGVVPGSRRHGLGALLKQHQRAWCLERGIDTITWTCDPLVRRNVAFNLHALGAEVVDYLPDHYGPMDDGLNRGDESDRLALRWQLLSDRAAAAETDRLPWVSSSAPLAVLESAGGMPVVTAVRPGARRVQLPADIEAIRDRDASLGRAWRLAIRDAVQTSLATGASVTGLTADGAVVLESG